MNLKVKIQVTTMSQYEMIDHLINDNYSKYPFLGKVRESINNNSFIGGHDVRSHRPTISVSSVSHYITNVSKDKEGILYGEVSITEGTSRGYQVKDLFDGGFELILLPIYIESSSKIVDFIALDIEAEIFQETEIYKKIIRNIKIDSLLN